MQKILNRFLLIFFISLIALLSIKILSQSTSQTLSVASTVVEDAKTSELDQKKIESIVDNYLITNPQVIISSLEALQKQKLENALEDKVKCLAEEKEKKTDTENHLSAPFLGNKNGSKNVTVFYDYNCSHCKKEGAVIEEIIKDPMNKSVKVLLRPYPILGENSMYLTQVSLAVFKFYPDKFAAFHKDLLSAPQSPSKEEVDKLLDGHGINTEQIKKSIADSSADPSIQNGIKKIFDLAQSLKVISVPTFIINGQIIPGEITKEKFQEILNDSKKEPVNNNTVEQKKAN